MKQHRSKSLDIDWKDDEYLGSCYQIVDDMTDEVADFALHMAQTLVKKDTGKLESEIEIVKSKFVAGGRAITAQGPGNYSRYYASFVELGHNSSLWKKKYKPGDPTVYIPPRPYMRPAIKAARQRLERKVREIFSDR